MRRLAASLAALLLLGCGSRLPEGTTSFTVGNTVVRTDSMLDVVGLLFHLRDTAEVPPTGPLRRWLQGLATELRDTVFAVARAIGPSPVAPVLETYAAPGEPDSACGVVAPRVRRCLGGNQRHKAAVRAFLDAARVFAPRTAPLVLEGLNAEARRRDLADVYFALTRSRALDGAVSAYTGYADLTFDVTLARTFRTGRNTPLVDPAEPRGPEAPRIFLAPDPVYLTRSYRSPSYVWLALGHQMAHAAVRRLFAERPELLERSIRLRPAVEGEMVRSGYTVLFWDEALGEQLARAITVRVLAAASPTITWAARTEALHTNMALVPWLEDALAHYEAQRSRYPTLTAFAGELAGALDSIPLDTCRAAPSPGVALAGVARSRAVVAWIADQSPFRATALLEGDTVVAVDAESVSAGGLLVPTRQLNLRWAQHLPFELSILSIRRRGRTHDVSAPIRWGPREAVRIASQARSAAARVGGELPVCRWVTRALR